MVHRPVKNQYWITLLEMGGAVNEKLGKNS